MVIVVTTTVQICTAQQTLARTCRFPLTKARKSNMNVSARQIATVQDKRVIAAIRTVQCIPYGSPNLVRRNAICCTRQMSGSRTLLVVGLLLASLVVASGRAPPPFTTKYFDQYLDHFNYESQPQTFKQR